MPRPAALPALLLVQAALPLGMGMRQRAANETVPPMRAFGPERRRHCEVPKERAAEAPSVIGGELVDSGDKYPFLAWLGDNDGTGLSQFCGGSLISERVVLTAGHCLHDSDTKNAEMYVRFRLANFRKEKGIARKVINWKRHPKYSRVNLHYDVTVLLLNESIPASVIKPIRLSDGTKGFEKSGDKRITGWGSTDEDCKIYDTLLRDATVPMGPYGESCATPGSKTLTRWQGFDYESQICAGMYTVGSMEYPGCGDSGGPLMVEEDGGWTQVGMVSWSYGIPWPDVFTRVSHFKDWIEATSRQMEQEGTWKH